MTTSTSERIGPADTKEKLSQYLTHHVSYIYKHTAPLQRK